MSNILLTKAEFEALCKKFADKFNADLTPMTRERDLLRRALDELIAQDDKLCLEFCTSLATWEIPPIIQEIRDFLAAKTEAEPVAWIVETELQDGSYSRWVCMDKKRYQEHHDSPNPIIPLYTRPEPE
jgi:hypothetical protein